jgi:hypothetical protein
VHLLGALFAAAGGERKLGIPEFFGKSPMKRKPELYDRILSAIARSPHATALVPDILNALRDVTEQEILYHLNLLLDLGLTERHFGGWRLTSAGHDRNEKLMC